MKQTCGICAYGDGKWNASERENLKKEDLPVCEFCKADGWTSDPQEIQDAFAKDPAFKLGIKSPYGHKKY